MAKNLKDKLVSVWLQQSQEYGQYDSRDKFYFESGTIYSYGSHFPIARLTTAPNGEDIILFTTRTYSSTTSRHIYAVRSGIRNSYRRVVYCYDVSAIFHADNLVSFKSAMDAYAIKHDKARKPELYAGDILYQAKLARDYCEVMCLETPAWALLPDHLTAGAALTGAMRVHQPEANRV